MSKDNTTRGLVGVIAIALVAFGSWFIYQNSDSSGCEHMASVVAADAYPVNEYPNAAERSALQDTYKHTYMMSC